MKVVRKGGEELGLVGGVEIHYIYTVYNFGPYLGLFLSILSAVGLKILKNYYYINYYIFEIYTFEGIYIIYLLYIVYRYTL